MVTLRSIAVYSDGCQYLRPSSYLSLRIQPPEHARTPPRRHTRSARLPDNRVVPPFPFTLYECAFIRYKSVSKPSSQSARRELFSGSRPVYPDKVYSEVYWFSSSGYLFRPRTSGTGTCGSNESVARPSNPERGERRDRRSLAKLPSVRPTARDTR